MDARPLELLISVGGATLGSAVLTWGALRYAHWRALLDHPGHRRSHRILTPRGGGVGPVLVLLTAAILLQTGVGSSAGTVLALLIGLALVAAVGWIDDHRALPILPRLAVHLFAAALFVSQLSTTTLAQPGQILVAVLQTLLLAGMINFWNFIDGIDGLIASQSLWVGVVFMLAFGSAGDATWALFGAAVAGACLGFLPFNFPRAWIFLGDVGSGALGFVCGALLLQAQTTAVVDWETAALIVSAPLIDAGLTLMSRMLRGRRWYTAHREHLYQWLVRAGRPHATVTQWYLLWNLIAVLPLLGLMHLHPAWSVVIALGGWIAGASLWIALKRRVLIVRRQGIVR